MSRRTKKREDGWYDINLVVDENVDEELKPLVIGEYVRHSLNKLGQLEDILEKYEIDDLEVLDQCLESQRFLANHDYSTLPREDFDKLFETLGAYKNIEKELGIDLITLFKALKDGIYVKSKIHGDTIRFIAPDCLVFDSEYLYELKYCKGYTKLKNNIYPFEFKDYGKTWALTKEDLL